MAEEQEIIDAGSSEESETETTEVQAEKLQQFYYECLGDRDWDAYLNEEHIFLKRNIGFAMFGNPGDHNSVEHIVDSTTGYTKKQNARIQAVYEAIMNHHFLEDTSKILVRTIFICCLLQNKKRSLFVEPVFVVKKCHTDDKVALTEYCKIFIDSNARVYENWEMFLENNKLPKCLMIFPKNGQYNGQIVGEDEVQVIIDKKESPACKIGNVILEGADTAGTVASIGSTLVFIAAAIPSIAVAPVVLTGAAVTGAGVGVYSVVRSTQTLVDRKKHKQSIGLDNSESRWCWLNTTVGVLGASASAATGLLTRAASKGVEISNNVRMAFNALSGANIIGSAANLGLSGYHIIDKLINKEKPTPLEVFQFASSVLFFHLSVVNFRTATTIISETQSTTIMNYESTLRSNRHRKLFRKARLEAKRLNGEIKGNAEVIRGIQNINDPDNFFAGLARINKDLNQNGARYTITTDGKVQINSNYIIDPMEFANMSKETRVGVLNSLPAYQQTPKTVPVSVFNAKNSYIIDVCKKLLPSPGYAIQIIQNLQSNKLDLQTITMLLQSYSESVIQNILLVLVKFLTEIKDSLNDFVKIHPLVSLPVGALQFLIVHLENMAREAQVNISVILQSLFTNNMSINNNFITDIKDKFNNWLKQKIEALRIANISDIDLSNAVKARKDCTICSGHYYETV